MAIYYFKFEATPNPDNPEREQYEGAIVNCWVDGTSMKPALTEAAKYVKNEGWKIEKMDDSFKVERERYEGNPELSESLECFDQALREGVSALFYVWPDKEL
ncbi:hypothetical protein [Planococcus shixiaomingii]|uniref:hypothetical protein n=1 Tax=Planococcus shixiaomingii TaxID=3058393 RepID=UPI002601C062|nr:hypothetical protein [Planococcus sp. N022]WKA56218.1 hypothetical protein QWY21_07715 [Planococcus sp. N022]